jgi:hypothetical protein
VSNRATLVRVKRVLVLWKLGSQLGNTIGKLLKDRKYVQWTQSCIDHKNNPKVSRINHHRLLDIMKGHVRPVANRWRQNINKAHSTSHLQSSKKRLGAIQSYLHHIKPSIGVGLKILVGAPLSFPLDGQTKGGVVVGTTRCKMQITRVKNWDPIGLNLRKIWEKKGLNES